MEDDDEEIPVKFSSLKESDQADIDEEDDIELLEDEGLDQVTKKRQSDSSRAKDITLGFTSKPKKHKKE